MKSIKSPSIAKKTNKEVIPSEEEKLNKVEAKGVLRNLSTSSDPQLVRSFRGHEGSVTAVAFQPQMKQVASASLDSLVYVWSFKPQQRPFKFVGHKGPVLDVQFSPNGALIASSGEDRQIRLWQNSVQNKCQVIKGHCGAVRSINFSTDGDYLLSASDDKTLKVWKVNDKKFMYSLSGKETGHKNWIRSGQFSPDTRIIGSGSDDSTVKLWDFNTQEMLHTFTDHQQGVMSVRFSPDGTCLASCSQDKTVKLFDIRSHRIIQHYDAHGATVNQISFHPSGYYLASASKDSKIKIWDLRQGKLAWTLYSHEKEVSAVNFNLAGDYFISGGADNLVMIWKSSFDDDIINLQQDPVSQANNFNTAGNLTQQTLFKSNKRIFPLQESKKENNSSSINVQKNSQQKNRVDYQEDEDFQRETITSKDVGTGTFGPDQNVNIRSLQQDLQSNQISEVLSGNLEKIVNQLDLVTSQLQTLDKRLSQNEENVKILLQNEKVQSVLEKYEVPINEGQHHSVWETFKELGFKQNELPNLNQNFDSNNFQLINTNIINEDNHVPNQQSFGTSDQKPKNIFSEGALTQTGQIQEGLISVDQLQNQ